MRTTLFNATISLSIYASTIYLSFYLYVCLLSFIYFLSICISLSFLSSFLPTCLLAKVSIYVYLHLVTVNLFFVAFILYIVTRFLHLLSCLLNTCFSSRMLEKECIGKGRSYIDLRKFCFGKEENGGVMEGKL